MRSERSRTARLAGAVALAASAALAAACGGLSVALVAVATQISPPPGRSASPATATAPATSSSPGQQHRVVSVPAAVLDGYAGVYAYGDGAEVTTVSREAEHLLVEFPGLSPQPMQPESATVFFGAGAYTVGLLAAHWGWNEPLSGLAAAAAVAGAIGFASGYVLLRTRGLALLMLTLCTMTLLQESANMGASYTGGFDGMPDLSFAPLLGVFRFDVLYFRSQYIYALAVLFLCFVLVRVLVGHDSYVYGMAWSADSRYLASTGSYDATVRV